jgi:hypothetical protein
MGGQPNTEGEKTGAGGHHNQTGAEFGRNNIEKSVTA